MTEENIIYQLLSEFRAAQPNNDETLDERELRVYLKEHRPAIIGAAFRNGLTVSGIEFQSLGYNDLTDVGTAKTLDLPSIVRLPNNAGIKVTTPSGYNIPVVSKENYILSLNSIIGKYQPKAYIEAETLYVYSGESNTDFMNIGSGIDSIIDEINTGLSIHLECILNNPDDDPNYDWTLSTYPLSQELISKLKTAVKRNNLNMILNTKADEVANMKNDNVLYHEQLRQNN